MNIVMVDPPKGPKRRGKPQPPDAKLVRALRIQRFVLAGAVLLMVTAVGSYMVTHEASARVHAAETVRMDLRSNAPRAVAGRPDWKDLWTTQSAQRQSEPDARSTVHAHVEEIIADGNDSDRVALASRDHEKNLDRFRYALATAGGVGNTLTFTKLDESNGRRTYRVSTPDRVVSTVVALESREDGWHLVACATPRIQDRR